MEGGGWRVEGGGWRVEGGGVLITRIIVRGWRGVNNPHHAVNNYCWYPHYINKHDPAEANDLEKYWLFIVYVVYVFVFVSSDFYMCCRNA